MRQTLQGVYRQFKGECCLMSIRQCSIGWQIIFSTHSTGLTGVQTLDLSNTLVDDADISIAIEECPELRVLNLAGCRKLTSVGEALLAPDTGKQAC